MRGGQRQRLEDKPHGGGRGYCGSGTVYTADFRSMRCQEEPRERHDGCGSVSIARHYSDQRCSLFAKREMVQEPWEKVLGSLAAH